MVTTCLLYSLSSREDRDSAALRSWWPPALPSGDFLGGSTTPCRPASPTLRCPCSGQDCLGVQGPRLFSARPGFPARRPVAGFQGAGFHHPELWSDKLLGAGLGLGPAGPHRPVSCTEGTVTAPLRDIPCPKWTGHTLGLLMIVRLSSLVFFLLRDDEFLG